MIPNQADPGAASGCKDINLVKGRIGNVLNLIKHLLQSSKEEQQQ